MDSGHSALALRAHCVRPKSLPAILSNPHFEPHLNRQIHKISLADKTRHSAQKKFGGEGGIRTHEHG